MSAPVPAESAPTTDVPRPHVRPRKSGRVVAFLAVLTLANVGALLVVASALADASDHGDEELAGLLVLSMIVTVAGLVGLGGAWTTRKWGPRVYLAAVVLDRLAALVAVPESFTPIAIVGVLLAVVLVCIAESSW